PDVWARVLREVATAYQATSAGAGAGLHGLMASPLKGAEGNVEFLAHFVAGRPRPAHPDLDPHLDLDLEIERAVAEAVDG
ncbi:MAG TPA: hypothetical protein VF244_04745, partial [Acidimicrobiales bacterium]